MKKLGAEVYGTAPVMEKLGKTERAAVSRGLRRRATTACLAMLVCLVGLYLARAFILRGLAAVLIVDENFSSVTHIIVPVDPAGYDAASELYRAHPGSRLLLIQTPPERLEAFGIVRPGAEVAREALSTRGVRPSDIDSLTLDRKDDWALGRCLAGFLAEHPEAEVVAVCDEFSTRRFRYILDHTMGAARTRIHLKAQPYPIYDAGTWWHSRNGVVHLFDAYLDLAYAGLVGEDAEQVDTWDPDLYEQSLRKP